VAASVSYNTRYSVHNRLFPIYSYPGPQISFTENGAEPVNHGEVCICVRRLNLGSCTHLMMRALASIRVAASGAIIGW